MRIKVTEDPGFQHDGVMYYAGNTYPDFPDDAGKAYCQAGMAEDLDGKVETGTRDIHNQVLVMGNAKHQHAAEEPGNG